MTDKNKLKPGQKKEKTVKLSEDKKMELMLNNKMKEMETDFDVNEHLVIDLGNALTKIGISGEDMPQLVIPSIYGHYNENNKKLEEANFDQKLDVFGYEALEYRNDYEITNLTPGNHKDPTSKEYLEFLKDALENKLGLTIPEYDVIVNISPIKNDENIRIYGRLFLEDLGFKSIAMINSSSVALYSTGRTSGLLVQCGETRTYTVPIYEGFPLYHAINKIRLGGRDLTAVFMDGIGEQKIMLPNSGEENESNFRLLKDDIKTLRNIKEKTCCVPYLNDYQYYFDNDEQDILPEEKILYKLPDETIVPIPKKTRLIASELLFNPSVIGKEWNGLNDLIISSIRKTEIMDDKLKQTLVENIVLTGGTTMINGFANRIYKDLANYRDSDSDWRLDYEPQVIGENTRHIGKWLGMSMIASMSSFDKLFIKKSEYQELGEEKFAEVAQIF